MASHSPRCLGALQRFYLSLPTGVFSLPRSSFVASSLVMRAASSSSSSSSSSPSLHPQTSHPPSSSSSAPFLWTPQPVPTVQTLPWTPTSARTGAVALKVGMTQRWDANGVNVPLTVLWLDECQVVKQLTPETDGYRAVQVGSGYQKRKNAHFLQRGHFDAAGVPPKRKLFEFKVSEDAMLPVGFEIGAGHFVPGQHVDVQGVTKGKGTQGVMKRHGFAGGNASHGSSKHHRKAGSTGACQSPGKRWKGTKMPGQMGNDKRTSSNLLVFAVDTKRNLVYVKGVVPGNRGSWVRIKDAKNPKTRDIPRAMDAPFPAAPREAVDFTSERFEVLHKDAELGTENTNAFQFTDPAQAASSLRVATPAHNPYHVFD